MEGTTRDHHLFLWYGGCCLSKIVLTVSLNYKIQAEPLELNMRVIKETRQAVHTQIQPFFQARGPFLERADNLRAGKAIFNDLYLKKESNAQALNFACKLTLFVLKFCDKNSSVNIKFIDVFYGFSRNGRQGLHLKGQCHGEF